MDRDKKNMAHANKVTIFNGMVISERGGRVTLFTPHFEENVIIRNTTKRRFPGEMFKITVFGENYHPRQGELDESNCTAWDTKIDGKKMGIETIFLPSRNIPNEGELIVRARFYDQFPWFGEPGHFHNEFIPFGKIRIPSKEFEDWLHTRCPWQSQLQMEVQMGRDGAIAIEAKRLTGKEERGGKGVIFGRYYRTTEEAGLAPLLLSAHPYVWTEEGHRPLRGCEKWKQQEKPQEDSEDEEWEIIAKDDLEALD
ncbi:hypothetical protein CRE_13742 [Caenorhabditis remanei]|uniref:Uncharacterized protein n=1 Tax=Caenorhabditis remanei TaxID=31234 RepID=E3NH58_CAERE|nr:hypothetical protein CRE_13742 [Caenorhabditis remanei]